MLQNKRIEQGMTQKDLSNKLGCNISVIQKYEQGQRNINGMKLEKIVKICEVLKCHITDILSDKELIKRCRKVGL